MAPHGESSESSSQGRRRLHARDPDRQEAAAEWIAWAKLHAERIDPLNHTLTMPTPPEPTAEALKPYLHGWNPYGPEKHGFH